MGYAKHSPWRRPNADDLQSLNQFRDARLDAMTQVREAHEVSSEDAVDILRGAVDRALDGAEDYVRVAPSRDTLRWRIGDHELLFARDSMLLMGYRLRATRSTDTPYSRAQPASDPHGRVLAALRRPTPAILSSEVLAQWMQGHPGMSREACLLSLLEQIQKDAAAQTALEEFGDCVLLWHENRTWTVRPGDILVQSLQESRAEDREETLVALRRQLGAGGPRVAQRLSQHLEGERTVSEGGASSYVHATLRVLVEDPSLRVTRRRIRSKPEMVCLDSDTHSVALTSDCEVVLRLRSR